MRTLIVVALILLSAQKAPADDQVTLGSGQYNGEVYVSGITYEQVERIPEWDPTETPAPLAPHKAVRLARTAFQAIVPEKERPHWGLQQVVLCNFKEKISGKPHQMKSAQKWYYIVHFWDNKNEIAAEPSPEILAKREQLRIVVLMNGEVCKPKRTPNKALENDSE